MIDSAVDEHPATILIIDDTPANLGVVVGGLEHEGYRIVTAQDGQEGVQRARHVRPDLVLLDVMMPGMSGFETCRQLKMLPETRNIPVIFMTSLTEIEDKIMGFKVGGVDYVTKPLQMDEVVARVGTHLSLHTMRKQLEAQNMLLQREIDERVQAEQALEEQDAFLRQVIDINPHFIFAKDREGRFTLANRALADATRSTVEAMIGKTDTDVGILPEEAENYRRDDLEVMRTKKEKVIPEETNTDPWGNIRILHTIKRPIYGKDGTVQQVLGVATDITARRLAERELEKHRQDLERQVVARTVELSEANQRLREEIAERTRAEAEIRRLNAELEARVIERTAQLTASNHDLEAFSYSVSHDLRTPLRSIDGFSRMLEEEYGTQLDLTGLDYIHRVRRSVQRMGLLIDDMLSLFRMSRREMHLGPIDLSELAQSAVSDLALAQPRQNVQVTIHPGLRTKADASLMRVALDNLFSNAWKFTRNCTPACIEFGREQHNGQAAYFVRDNGAGFDMSHADKLFMAFRRAHRDDEFEGTGIGLATVQRAIQRHGGRVWIESAVNQGTTVYFVLPQ